MKKTIILLLLCFCLIFMFSIPAAALNIDAASCVLIDAATGRVLYENNAHEVLPPASTTKMLTALIALESMDDISQEVTLPDDYVNVGESGIYLEAGETHTLEDMLYALMLKSANDAAQAVAIAISGSEETFVEKMNERVLELGLMDSTFANPHGLDAEGHLTSAYDLAMIAREAVTIPFFNELITTESWYVPWEDNDYERFVYNHNKFLDQYPGADGIKTGYTSKAGNCLVASATRDGMRLIGVVLNCPNQTHYKQMTLLMDYGFSTYKAVRVAKAGDDMGTLNVNQGDISEVGLVLGSDIVIALPNNSTYEPKTEVDLPFSLEAPCDMAESIGMISFSDNLGNGGEVPIYISQSVERYTFVDLLKSIWQSFMNALL